MNKGDTVVVIAGIKDPDFDTNIGGWLRPAAGCQARFKQQVIVFKWIFILLRILTA